MKGLSPGPLAPESVLSTTLLGSLSGSGKGSDCIRQSLKRTRGLISRAGDQGGVEKPDANRAFEDDRERDNERESGMKANFPRAANPAQQPGGPEDGDPSLDEYELYGLAHSHLGAGGRKGRTKREAAANTNRPSPGGHERKLVTKLQNTERKRRGARS